MPSPLTTPLKHNPIPQSTASFPTSRSLVPVGPRHVSTRGNRSIRNEKGEKPSTTRALVLRNGKYGARGTGEMILISKLSGREKLDLLAEDLVRRSKTAVMAPFRLEHCLKIAESQCNAFLDDVTNLRDPQLFSHLIQAELTAREKKDNVKSSSVGTPSYVASAIATKVHNTYLLASAWKLVSETLAQFAINGLTDSTIKSQLQTSANIRARYLALYELANLLVNVSQNKVSVLAMTTPHYSRYFKPTPDNTDSNEPNIIFDWAELREAGISFLDSIIIELCFPRGPYPEAILFQVLHDAVDESPKEAKRFPQELWNAIGDLSVSIELRQLLEAPLAGQLANLRRNEPYDMPKEYKIWFDAQLNSEKASKEYSNYENLTFPLHKTRSPAVLDDIWKYINLNYKTVSGEDIDTLWRLSDALSPTPQWHPFHTSTSDSHSKLSSTSIKWQTTNSELLTITNGSASDDSMPGLQTVSNSEDENDFEEDSDEDYDESDETDESSYDTEEEDGLREMLREAMDTAHDADWLHEAEPEDSRDPFKQDARKGNPFMKLLGSLRGRMFSSSSKLKTATHTEPFKPSIQMLLDVPETFEDEARQGLPSEEKSHQATVEDAEDESEPPQAKKKKKKKKYKKKKKLTAVVEQYQEQEPNESAIKPSVSSSNSKSSPSSPLKKAVPKLTLGTKPPSFYEPTSSLPLFTDTSAQSARSYIQAGNLGTQKLKVKSRPNHATVFNKKPIGSWFSRLINRARGNKEEEHHVVKHSGFSRLGKKSRVLMHQLLNTSDDETKGTAPMKWDKFVKIMEDMGFKYVPSTAGSSVRFDPPDRRDGSITFHKPHPDPTLNPIMLKGFAKRLKKHYGWDEEGLLGI